MNHYFADPASYEQELTKRLVPRLVERRSPLIAPARTREALSINCSSLRRVFSSNNG